MTCQDPVLETFIHHTSSHGQQQLRHLQASRSLARQCGGTECPDSAQAWLHLPSSHPQSNLTSFYNTLGVAWQRQYQHGNSCSGMVTAILAWQRGCLWRHKNVRQIPPPYPSQPFASQGSKAAPSALGASNRLWALGTMVPTGLATSPPHCPALHEMSCWVSAQVS